jgi:Cellulase (glycosyl hydrolase family 5)
MKFELKVYHSRMEFIQLSTDKQRLVVGDTNQYFRPVGFNYDRDSNMRLIEEYWRDEWSIVSRDLEAMRKSGANIVRVHLQLPAFMTGPDTLHQDNLNRLAKLIDEAERLGLYLDITGLGSYRNQDPAWYADATEADRWEIQARFWRAIAQVGASSPTIAWYDLINEPTMPKGPVSSYVVPFPTGSFFYVNSLVREPDNRTPDQVITPWIAKMKTAICEVDSKHLIGIGTMSTLGVPPEVIQVMFRSLPPHLLAQMSEWRPGMQTLITPERADLDLFLLHEYPQENKVADTAKEVERWQIAGKPVVLEETFPLHCSVEEWKEFIAKTQDDVGVLSFYWGQPKADDLPVQAGLDAIHELNS